MKYSFLIQRKNFKFCWIIESIRQSLTILYYKNVEKLKKKYKKLVK